MWAPPSRRPGGCSDCGGCRWFDRPLSSPQVQGMSFIAAVLILNLDTADAFIAFSNLLNKPCQMAFFRVDHGLVSIPMCVWVPGCRVCTEQERPGPSVRQESSIFPSPGLLAASSTVQCGGLPGRCVDPEKWAANSHTCEFRSAFFQQVSLRINLWHERGGVPPPTDVLALCQSRCLARSPHVEVHGGGQCPAAVSAQYPGQCIVLSHRPHRKLKSPCR